MLLLLALYVSGMYAWDLLHPVPTTIEEGSPLRLGQLFEPLPFLVALGRIGLAEIARFGVLGLLVSLALGVPTPEASRRAAAARLGLTLLVGVALMILAETVHHLHFPHPVALVLPVSGLGLGMWVGQNCRRGYRSALWLVPKLALAAVLLASLAAATLYAATSSAPLAFKAPKVTPTQKRRLVETIRAGQRQDDGTTRLELSQEDVNLLMAMAFQHLPLQGKGMAVFGQDRVAMDVSTRTPRGWPFGPYLNAQGRYDVKIESGQLRFHAQEFRIGSLAIPSLLLKLSGPVASLVIDHDPSLREALASVQRLRVSPGSVEAVYRTGKFRGDISRAIKTHLGEDRDVASATAAYYRHLLASVDPEARGDARFVAFLRTAFALADERSQDGDPVLENRAAILALGILLGHERLESVVGSVSTPQLRASARRTVGQVTVRDRQDWVKHFLVSAALAVLSNEVVSDSAGLFKEEFDAGKGGSGFSFGDLLADRAGTQFGLAAIRDPQTALRIQESLRNGFQIEAIFPPAADLPEGIPDVRLQREYGGVGGTRFREVTREIGRRVASCPLLNPS